MFTRFTHITNGLKALGREYSIEDNVQKFLHPLLASWHAKSTAIEEAKDLSKVTLDEQIGSLMTYEIKKKNAAAEAEVPKKATGIALKAGKQKELVEEEENDDDDDKVALLTRRFRNFLMNKRNGKQKEKGESSITCYNCKKIGHRMADCPLFKNKGNNQQGDKKKFKAMNATEWDKLDGTSTDEEIEKEATYFCLMADEQSEVNSDDEYLPSYEELEENCRKLYIELKASKKKLKLLEENHSRCKQKQVCSCDTLKEENASLSLENEKLTKEYINCKESSQKEVGSLKSQIIEILQENSTLKKKVEDQNNTIYKFTNGKKIFDKLLGAQRFEIFKEGLG
ncbi:uncharacterized protein LOC131158146 [Malania oleifera]|uniref:uncharacterized protein LOC131158146 n=1 Tax=Malania oleifera TaxID=397392 RepID=UPI0025AE5413|nr:uncharacterized protein LOC131158146 [Malania oleifera]